MTKQDQFSGRKIRRIIEKEKEIDLWITLSKPVPVYLVYFTAWVDGEGTAHFRDDIYGHDKAMLARLFEKEHS